MVYRGATMSIEQSELPLSHIAQADVVYVTSLSGNASKLLPTIVKHAKQTNKLVACNPGTSQLKAGADLLRDALADIDILILNSDEAHMLMNSLVTRCSELQKKVKNTKPSTPKMECPQLLKAPLQCSNFCFNLELFFHEILNRGPRVVVVTNGVEGVYGADKTGIYFCPSIEAPIASTLGAGDAFGSCFVASIPQGATLQEALVRGSLNSASVIGQVGAKNGLLTKDKLDKKFAAIGIKIIKKFDL